MSFSQGPPSLDFFKCALAVHVHSRADPPQASPTTSALHTYLGSPECSLKIFLPDNLGLCFLSLFFFFFNSTHSWQNLTSCFSSIFATVTLSSPGPGRTCHFVEKYVHVWFYLDMVCEGEGEVTEVGRYPDHRTVKPVYKVSAGFVGSWSGGLPGPPLWLLCVLWPYERPRVRTQPDSPHVTQSFPKGLRVKGS